MEYTKGEWKIEGHTVVSDALRYGIWLYKIADVTAHAQVETIANANLIAAAPDMYEALKAVQCYWHSCYDIWDRGENMMLSGTESIRVAGDDLDKLCDEASELTEQALAKAEGK